MKRSFGPAVGDTVRKRTQPEQTAVVTGMKMNCIIVRLPSGKPSYWGDGTYDRVEPASWIEVKPT